MPPGLRKEYTGMFPFMRRFCDKTVLEHVTKPGRKVFLHYMLQEEAEGEDYRKAEMREVAEDRGAHRLSDKRVKDSCVND